MLWELKPLGWCFHSFFWALPNFQKCFYNSVETQKTCFWFVLENTMTKEEKITCLLWSSKCKFSLPAPSLCQQLVLGLCFYRVRETLILTNQRAHVYFIWAFLYCCLTRAYVENKHCFCCPFFEHTILKNEAILNSIPKLILWCCVSSVFNVQNLILPSNQ